MQLMMKFQRLSKLVNIGTICEVVLLLFNALLWFLAAAGLPAYLISVFPSLYGESIITISYMIVYAALLLLLYIYNKMEKDIQKAIKITIVRALFGVILPIILLFPLATILGLVWILALLFFILSLIRFLLVLRVALKLQALQKKYST